MQKLGSEDRGSGGEKDRDQNLGSIIHRHSAVHLLLSLVFMPAAHEPDAIVPT